MVLFGIIIRKKKTNFKKITHVKCKTALIEAMHNRFNVFIERFPLKLQKLFIHKGDFKLLKFSIIEGE